MKRLLQVYIIAWLALSGVGCATHYWSAKCRHEAIFTTSVVAEHYPVAVAVGDLSGELHAIGVAEIDGAWHYLKIHERMEFYSPQSPNVAKKRPCGVIATERAPRGFQVARIVSVDQFIQEMR